eukprot:SAG22_NODE_1345_length_4675_cov_2.245629_6_plen_115_part_00
MAMDCSEPLAIREIQCPDEPASIRWVGVTGGTQSTAGEISRWRTRRAPRSAPVMGRLKKVLVPLLMRRLMVNWANSDELNVLLTDEGKLILNKYKTSRTSVPAGLAPQHCGLGR